MRGYDLTIIDIGGQRSERKKWFPMFDDVSIVLFCASLSEYDQCLQEDHTKNRMLESLELFDFALNRDYLEDCSFVLFMNKQDLFEEKLKNSPLESFFDDYTGGQDAEMAKQYMLNKYLEVNRKNRIVYPYFTCATDTELMKVVFNILEEKVLSKALEYLIG